MIGNLQQHVNDIVKKILSEPVADLWLAAYLILSLGSKDIIKVIAMFHLNKFLVIIKSPSVDCQQEECAY